MNTVPRSHPATSSRGMPHPVAVPRTSFRTALSLGRTAVSLGQTLAGFPAGNLRGIPRPSR
jgi:hypothetical protein